MDTGPIKELLRFLSEDIRRGDITSALLTKKKIVAKIISRQQGVIAGIKFAKNLFQLKGCNVKAFVKDGAKVKPNQKILQVSGNAQSVLSCERTALNLLSRMSGISSKNIITYASTGVDMISVGSITNSVTGLDLSLEVISNSSR